MLLSNFVTRLEGIIIVLGSPNDENGNLSEMALARAQTAFSQHRIHPNYMILPTGGFGEHFNTTNKTHGYYLKKYLIKLGIKEDLFLEVAESKNTPDDAFKAMAIVKKYQLENIIVVSSDFHMERVRYIFDRVFEAYKLNYVAAPYLPNCPKEEAIKIASHEKQAIAYLRTGKWLQHTEISRN